MEQFPVIHMGQDLNKIWNDVQGLLEAELKGPKYQTWLRPTKLISLENHHAVVGVKNEFSKGFISGEYFNNILNALEKVLNAKLTLEIVVSNLIDVNDLTPSIATLENAPTPKTEKISEYDLRPAFIYGSNLNPAYSFDNFIVGKNNEFSYAVAQAASHVENNEYNPLFIYSSPGLGKTHLVSAIGNQVISKNRSAKVRYINSESFMNELIGSLKTNNMSSFRDKFRNLDLLILDDIQFFEGKEATQEEFFHTFNALKDNGKKVILTSDRPPSKLTSLSDRLRSRFEAGLIADIQNPTIETRMEILIMKAKELQIEMEETVAEYMSQVYSGNVRELEGALKKVNAYLAFSKKELTLQNVQKVLRLGEKQEITPLTIVNVCAGYFNLSVNELLSTKKSHHLTYPRHIAVYILHKYYGISFPRISDLFSKRTHSSAIYAYNQIRKKLPLSPQVGEDISLIRRMIEKR